MGNSNPGSGVCGTISSQSVGCNVSSIGCMRSIIQRLGQRNLAHAPRDFVAVDLFGYACITNDTMGNIKVFNVIMRFIPSRFFSERKTIVVAIQRQSVLVF
jgi:hypothetical protein